MRIAIIGLGLIGGSIGLALKQARGPQTEVVGYARKPETASAALKLRAVDRTEATIAAAVQGCALAVVCTPVRAVEEAFQELAVSAPAECVVTDTASTKLEVLAWAGRHLRPRLEFIGGHPMAGKETAGIEAAEAGLFKSCTYCLTPASWAGTRSVELARQVVRWVGAKPLLIDAAEHDFLVAGISHLPILVSAAMVATTTGDSRWGTMAKLAASGYRDVTRLASGSAQVNTDIFATNREAVVHWIDQLTSELNSLKEQVQGDEAKLKDSLEKACLARNDWLRQRNAGHGCPNE